MENSDTSSKYIPMPKGIRRLLKPLIKYVMDKAIIYPFKYFPNVVRATVRERVNANKSGDARRISVVGSIAGILSLLAENIEISIMKKAVEASEDDKVNNVSESLGSVIIFETAETTWLRAKDAKDARKTLSIPL